MVAEVGGSPSLSFEGYHGISKNIFSFKSRLALTGLVRLCRCVVSWLRFAFTWSLYTAERADSVAHFFSHLGPGRPAPGAQSVSWPPLLWARPPPVLRTFMDPSLLT